MLTGGEKFWWCLEAGRWRERGSGEEGTKRSDMEAKKERWGVVVAWGCSGKRKRGAAGREERRRSGRGRDGGMMLSEMDGNGGSYGDSLNNRGMIRSRYAQDAKRRPFERCTKGSY